MLAHEWLKLAVEKGASDIFIGAGRHVSFKINGVLTAMGDEPVDIREAEDIVTHLYALAQRPMDKFKENLDDDFPITLPKVARFRVSAYNQRGSLAAVIRIVLFDLPDHKNINIPDQVMNVIHEKNGLVLVTGPTGSGKTTTLACVIDAFNKTKSAHIITLEDPIEFLHRDQVSIISQREIATDTKSYLGALRACLRQTPDVILLGEMRDAETIRTALTAAETGHLVISTLHTLGAAKTVDRIIGSFPAEEQPQVRLQVATLLRTVISQLLLEKKDGGGVIPAFEIMNVNKEIARHIAESNTAQIDSIIKTAKPEMIGIDEYLMNLVQDGQITMETALSNANNPDHMATVFSSRYFDAHRDGDMAPRVEETPYF